MLNCNQGTYIVALFLRFHVAEGGVQEVGDGQSVGMLD